MEHRRADFENFVAHNTDALLRTAYLIVSDLPEAEDLVQEVLLELARRWHRVRRMDHPVAYARRILVTWRSAAPTAAAVAGESSLARRSLIAATCRASRTRSRRRTS